MSEDERLNGVKAVASGPNRSALQKPQAGSLAQLVGAVAIAGDAILVADGAWRILLISARAQYLLGSPSSELTGKPVERVLPQLPAQANLSLIAGGGIGDGTGDDAQAHPRGTHLMHAITVAAHADGSSVPLEVDLSEITSQGQPVRVIRLYEVASQASSPADSPAHSPALAESSARAQDSTDGLALSAEEARAMARLPDENPYPVFRMDAAGNVVYANTASAALLQNDSRLPGLAAGQGIAFWRDLGATALRERTRLNADVQVSDQTYSFSIVPNASGEYVNFYGVDDSTRRQTETALAQALERTRELYQNARQIGRARGLNEVLKVLRSNSQLRRCHRAAISLFSRPWNEESQPPESLFIAADWNEDPAVPSAAGRVYTQGIEELSRLPFDGGAVLVADVEADGRLEQQTHEYMRHFGTHCYASFPLIAGGDFYGLVNFHFRQPHAIGADDLHHVQGLVDHAAVAIHNMKLLETEAQARVAAEKASELRLKFLAMISHELRTPLTPIKGLVTTLLAEDVTWDAESQREFLTIVNDETDKLTELIEQLLDLSRMEAGLLSIKTRELPLSTIINTAAAQLSTLAHERVLKLEIDADLPLVKADPRRIAQVLVNIVGNAVRYTSPGSPITITAQRAADEVRVDVIDEGQGIDPEDRPYVFEAFRRGNDDRTRRVKGAGLGLAICKGLVEAHGGRIWLTPRDGPGTDIAFTLPAA